MEGFETLISRGENDNAVNLLELRDLLNSKTEEELKESRMLWSIVGDEIPGFTIREIYEASENHYDCGDGATPESIYFGDETTQEEKDEEEIVIPKGALVLMIDGPFFERVEEMIDEINEANNWEE